MRDRLTTSASGQRDETYSRIGENDPVRDDVTTYAQRLRASGVPVPRPIIAGAGHGELLRAGSGVMADPRLTGTGVLGTAFERHQPIRTPHHQKGNSS